MKSTLMLTLALLAGGILGFTASQYLPDHHPVAAAATSESGEKKPLYWVAPMDPNYRRDEPGKSPMGMDLIPVYEETSDANEKQGMVKINPAVENNLGVRTATVSQIRLTPQIDTVGYISFDQSRLWQTNSRVSGWVEQLNINAIGESVRQGDVLFTLYSPELVKAQEELLSAYRSGRKGLINGAKERLTALGLDSIQIRQIIQRGRASQNVAIKAPDDGVIEQLNIRQGGYLSPTQTVIRGGSLDEVWIDVEVFERQSHWIKTGTDATMTLSAFPGRQWRGKVDFIYPVLDPQTRTLRVRLKFANSGHELKPNMFAYIKFQAESETPVLSIPREAVIRSGGMSRVVLAEGDGKYRSARIETGREADQLIEVLAGLSPGDKVVTSAQFMLDSESSQSADLSRINEMKAGTPTMRHDPVTEWHGKAAGGAQ